MKPRKRSTPCRYAESCFECPRKDCTAEDPAGVNEILDDWLYYELVTGQTKKAGKGQLKREGMEWRLEHVK